MCHEVNKAIYYSSLKGLFFSNNIDIHTSQKIIVYKLKVCGRKNFGLRGYMHFYRPQTKFPKVMFLHMSVSHSVHGVGSGIPACLAGLQGGGVSQHALQISRPTPKGEVEGSGWGVSRPTPRGSPGPHPGGSPGPHLGGCITACTEVDTCLTATAAGGTHPTGMHSCWQFIFVSYNIP